MSTFPSLKALHPEPEDPVDQELYADLHSAARELWARLCVARTDVETLTKLCKEQEEEIAQLRNLSMKAHDLQDQVHELEQDLQRAGVIIQRVRTALGS